MNLVTNQRHIRAIVRMEQCLLQDLREANLTDGERADIQAALSDSTGVLMVLTSDNPDAATSDIPWPELLRETVRAHERTRGGFGDVLQAIGYASEMVRE